MDEKSGWLMPKTNLKPADVARYGRSEFESRPARQRAMGESYEEICYEFAMLPVSNTK